MTVPWNCLSIEHCVSALCKDRDVPVMHGWEQVCSDKLGGGEFQAGGGAAGVGSTWQLGWNSVGEKGLLRSSL